MSSEPIEGFATNWAYLKTELNWLERLLMLAIARQRKDTKDIERVARTRADKATSHWWKGVVALEGDMAYDEHRKTATSPTQSYQQQLEAQLQASQQRGVMLALPTLCDRLHLTRFEKHVILMSLAPEVNRRYANLYRYLQGDALGFKTDLPTVDLALRLFCRNDGEWRAARTRLGNGSPLLRHGLATLMHNPIDTFLNAPIKLSEGMMQYLMADIPTLHHLDALLQPPPTPADPVCPPTPCPLSPYPTTATWSTLTLPDALIHSLQHLVEVALTPSPLPCRDGAIAPKGQLVLLVGGDGRARTAAAEAIAQGFDQTLVGIDLQQIDPADYGHCWAALDATTCPVVLINGADRWLRRSAQGVAPALHRLWQTRRGGSLTLFSVDHKESVALRWLRQIDAMLEFPSPRSPRQGRRPPGSSPQ